MSLSKQYGLYKKWRNKMNRVYIQQETKIVLKSGKTYKRISICDDFGYSKNSKKTPSACDGDELLNESHLR